MFSIQIQMVKKILVENYQNIILIFYQNIVCENIVRVTRAHKKTCRHVGFDTKPSFE